MGRGRGVASGMLTSQALRHSPQSAPCRRWAAGSPPSQAQRHGTRPSTAARSGGCRASPGGEAGAGAPANGFFHHGRSAFAPADRFAPPVSLRLLARLRQGQQGVQCSHHQRGNPPLRPRITIQGTSFCAAIRSLDSAQKHKAHWHAHDQCRAHALLCNQAGQLERRGALPMPTMAPCSKPRRWALRMACAARVVSRRWASSTTSASEMNWWVCMPKCARRGMDRPEQIASTSATTGAAAAQHGGDASVHGLRVKVFVSPVEVAFRVDHAAHDGPLLCRVAVRLDLCVNDGKAVVLDGRRHA